MVPLRRGHFYLEEPERRVGQHPPLFRAHLAVHRLFFHRPLASLTQERKDRKELQSHVFLALQANKNLPFFARFTYFEP
jgi:hypothetical protein